jgi:hypothetical protein
LGSSFLPQVHHCAWLSEILKQVTATLNTIIYAVHFKTQIFWEKQKYYKHEEESVQLYREGEEICTQLSHAYSFWYCVLS